MQQQQQQQQQQHYQQQQQQQQQPYAQALPSSGGFPYSFVGMQHSWAKAILPGYAGPANMANARLRESESQTDDDAELDAEAIANAKAAVSRARGASPVEELFDAVRIRELAYAQQSQAEAIEAAQSERMKNLEMQNERLKVALMKLRANFSYLKQEIAGQHAQFDVLQEYAMSLEADNHTLRGQVAYMQQFFTNAGAGTAIPDDADSVTAQANGPSSFYYPGPVLEHYDSYEEDRRLQSLQEASAEQVHYNELVYRREGAPGIREYEADYGSGAAPGSRLSGHSEQFEDYAHEAEAVYHQEHPSNALGCEKGDGNVYGYDEDDGQDNYGELDDDDDDSTDFRQYEDLEPTTALQL
ncbi:Hypothetical Protein FCC1311_108222 [Hondaea fermentalgiana]|uniref:Uncharacterized protein n=1 Tax=Hondaea fermentalgiana TaxID=2315210 RepID=A0A2R5H1C7_9STRA|nr:Hypothetical Protein FCC1311_108222 [Hondaea fermentalgiana]|eukprot:GBG34601.1 Hypothetical Protein FCC1311_108222 [Hondaea fermentalgiana]